MRYLPRLLVVLLLLGMASCRTAPIYNAQHSSFNTQVTTAQATQAIRQAGAKLGWDMTVQDPGRIRGVLNLRSHQAVVDITYDTTAFTIAYVDSTNLNYDGAKIHSNYNGWIQNLEREIRVQASSLS